MFSYFITAWLLLFMPWENCNAKENSGILSVKLPTGWSVAGRKEISDKNQLKEAKYEKFDFVFRKSSSENLFDYPYGLLKINLTKHLYKERSESIASGSVLNMSADILLKADDKIYFEKAAGIFWQKVEIQDDSDTIVRITAFIPSSRGSYNFYFFVKPKDFESLVPDVFQMVRGIREVAENENRLQSADEKHDQQLFIIMTVFLMLIFPLGVIICYLYLKKDTKIIVNIIKAVLSLIGIMILFNLLSKFLLPNNILLQQIAIFILILLIAIVLSKGSPKIIGFSISFELKRQLKLILLWVFLMPALPFTLTAILHYSGYEVIGLNHDSITIKYDSNLFKSAAIIGAVSEEIIYRGIIYWMILSGSIRKTNIIFLRKLKLSIPIIVSSLLFGASHLAILAAGANIAGTAVTVTYALVLGTLFGYFRETTGSIYPGMVLHVILNSGVIFYIIRFIVK